MFDEALLSGAEVAVVWASLRDWKPGAVVRGWSGVGLGVGLYVVLSGMLEVELDGKTWRVQPGEAFLVPTDLPRDRIEAPQGAQWLSVGLRVQFHGRLSLAPLLGGPQLWTPSVPLAPLASAIVAEWEDVGGPALVPSRRPKNATSRLIANGLATGVFGICWRDLRASSESATLTRLDAPLWLWQALQQIRREPSRDITQLCQKLSVSPAHLRRTFHRFLGQSPQSYLTEERLRAARQLLVTTDQTVAVIATEVGFESLSHFTRIFTQRYLHPPARYRQLLRSPGA